MSYKYCVVPNCGNSTVNSPEKWFIHVPNGPKNRKKWFNLMRRKNHLRSRSAYACGDHFNLPEDVENFMYVKLMRTSPGPTIKIRLKKGVLPSKFECQHDTRYLSRKKRSVPSVTEKLRRRKMVKELLDLYTTTQTENSSMLQPRIQSGASNGAVGPAKVDVGEINAEESEVLVKDEPEVLVNVERDVLVKDEPYMLVNDEPDILVNDEPYMLVTDEPGVLVNDEPGMLVKDEAADDMLTIKEEEEELMVPDQEVSIKAESWLGDGAVKSERIDLDVVKEECGDSDKPTPDLVVRKCQVVVTKLSDREIQKWLMKSKNGKQLKPYKCHICKYRGKSASRFDAHVLSHKGEKRYACDQCDYRAGIRTHLENHKRIHTGERPFECKFCGYRAYQLGNLLEHEKIHRGIRPYKCAHCDYRAVRKRHLTAHLLVHEAKKPFKCDSCDYQTSNNQALGCHKKKHTGEKPYKCDYCNYRTAQKGSVKTHMKATHLRDKPLICKDCGYECVQKSVMKTHMYTHTGKRPFSCYHCGFSTSYKPSLAKHVHKDHSGSSLTTGIKSNEDEIGLPVYPQGPVKRFRVPARIGSRSFICSICSYTTSHKASFFRHTSNRHSSLNRAQTSSELRQVESPDVGSGEEDLREPSPASVKRDLRKRAALKQPGRFSDFVLSSLTQTDNAVDVSGDDEPWLLM